ncbi:MAG: benzoate-CoA ligase family protein [Burkholderiales bacterium]|nr:benzoate-CoA ligase family protein [Burkholderiales bacterium]
MVKGEPVEFAIPERLNLGAWFLDINLESGRGDRTALLYGESRCSYSDLWRLTNRMGNVLKRLGVEPENRVLLILEDSPEWVAAWLGTLKLGAVGTHAYTYLTPQDYGHLLALVRPKVVVVDGVTLERLREAARASRRPPAFLVAGDTVPALGKREYSLAAMLESAGEDLEAEPTHRDDIAFWNFSGGTTGSPKGVPHLHRDGVVCAEVFDRVFRYTAEDVVVRVPKLFFHYARDLGLLFPLRHGASIVLSRGKSSAAQVLSLIARHRPTVLITVPTMMRAMIQAPERERADLGCVRYCASSGEPLSAQLHREWVEAFGVEVTNRYGSAESGMGMLDNRPGVAVPGSSGTVTPSVEIRLVDAGGRDVPAGEPGTLLARCAAAGRGYVREHERSAQVFLGNGWVNTGDLFRQDARGYFWYLGRADEMVKVSGIWVSPLEVEQGLAACPGVGECAVLAVQDEDGLVKLRAFVAPAATEPVRADLAASIRRACRERLAPHKVPGTIEIVDELPRTGPGKIDRRALRERVALQRHAPAPVRCGPAAQA